MLSFSEGNQWGQSYTVPPEALQDGTPFFLGGMDVLRPVPGSPDGVVVSHGVPVRALDMHRVPKVQNLGLYFWNPPAQNEGSGGNFFRWLVEWGVGGASQRLLVDATSFQQLSLSAERLSLAVLVEAPGGLDTAGTYQWPHAFAAPTEAVRCAYFIADGATLHIGPTYTQLFRVAASSTYAVPIPKGAVDVRVIGVPGAATGPFTATFSLKVNAPGLGDTYLGNYIAGVRLAPIPLPGSTLSVTLTNTDGADPCDLGLVWGFDL
jgi:hypothetical protein